MNAVYDLLAKTSRARVFWPLLFIELVTASALVSLMVMIHKTSGGMLLPDLEISYSVEKIEAMFHAYGSHGMLLFQNLHLIDLYHPALYSVLLASVMYRLVRGSRLQWVPVMALLGGALDYLENAFIWMMMATYPGLNPTLVEMSSTVSIVKNLAFVGIAGLFVLSFLFWLVRAKPKEEAN